MIVFTIILLAIAAAAVFFTLHKLGTFGIIAVLLGGLFIISSQKAKS